MEKTGNGQATGDRQRAVRLTGDGKPETGNRQVGELRIGSDIAARLLELAADVVRVVKSLPKDATGKHIGLQLLRAATSGGANYEEARAGESPADFIHKVGIATKELREAAFWLKLVRRTQLTPIALDSILSEANQLASILAASSRTARRRLEQAG